MGKFQQNVGQIEQQTLRQRFAPVTFFACRTKVGEIDSKSLASVYSFFLYFSKSLWTIYKVLRITQFLNTVEEDQVVLTLTK